MSAVIKLRDGQNTSDTHIGIAVAEPASIAQRALEQSEGKRGEAIDLLVQWMDEDPAIARVMLENYFRKAALAALQKVWRKSPPPSTRTEPAGFAGETAVLPSALMGITAVANRNLMEFVLPCGTRLSDAMRIDLVDAADRYAVKAKDLHVTAVWLKRVAERVPPGKRVREVLTVADLERLK